MSVAEKSPPASSADSPPPATAASPATGAGGGDGSGSADGSIPGPHPTFVMPPGMQFVPYFPPVAATGEGGESNGQPQAQMMIHPAFLSQMYSYPYPGVLAPGMKLKRKQVKNACTNCQKACKKCDDERPCPRCVKYGIADECSDSVRKERRKGIKRGSYKKKCEQSPMLCLVGSISRTLALPAGLDDDMENAPPAFMPGYSAALYQQWAAAAMSAAAAGGKPGEGTAAGYYPYFIAPAAQGSEGTVTPESAAAAAAAAAANPYFAQMYYGAAAAGYPPGYPVPGFGADAGSSGKSAPKTTQESEDELEAEEEDEEEPPESPKRKTKKKPRGSD
jgi:hypothetical protein